MKFGEFAALLSWDNRVVRVNVEGYNDYSTINTDGKFGNILNDFEITEIAIVNSMFSLKLKEAGA